VVYFELVFLLERRNILPTDLLVTIDAVDVSDNVVATDEVFLNFDSWIHVTPTPKSGQKFLLDLHFRDEVSFAGLALVVIPQDFEHVADWSLAISAYAFLLVFLIERCDVLYAHSCLTFFVPDRVQTKQSPYLCLSLVIRS
jgi:hypothetical protein